MPQLTRNRPRTSIRVEQRIEFLPNPAVPKFVLASTSSLYGADAPVPYREDARANRPLSPYAASKKAAEGLAFAYHHLYPALDVSVLRYFTVYGPAGRPDMSVFRFIEQLRAGLPLTVYGDGSQSRDFTYVDDVARGTVAALRPCGFEIINLGGDSPVLLSSLIDRLGKLLGRVPAIEYHPAHPADVHATWADVAKARHLLKWSPSVTLDEGLRRTVDWHLAAYTSPLSPASGPSPHTNPLSPARGPSPHTNQRGGFVLPTND
ncbi:MAG: NAD-dependent epimerase/dehydratase family protein [Pirellulales bacterium]